MQTSYTYDPFGNPSVTGATSSNTQQYTGRETDGTGLQYNRARYYSPTLQRFISEDPLGFGGGDVNLYAYAGNDPINASDPSGQFIIGVIAVVGLLGCGAGAWYGWTHSRKDRWTYAAGDALVGCAAGAYAGAAIAVAAVAAAAGAGGAAVAAVVAGGGAVEAAIEGGAGDEATSTATDVIAVIGRFPDYLAVEGQPGYEVLNDPNWNPDVNDAWVQSVIDRRQKVFVASPETPENMVNERTGDESQFSIELRQFRGAGYTKVGDYLIPPGGTP